MDSDKCESMNDYGLGREVREKLGQTQFPTPVFKCNGTQCGIGNYCDQCIGYLKWKKDGHLRFDFDAGSNIAKNKKIIELFTDDFGDYRVVIHSRKGEIFAYVVYKNNYDRYDYWNKTWSRCDIPYPCESVTNFTGDSTLDIIRLLICSIRAKYDIE